MLTSDVAAFVGFACESLLYGVNAVLFGVSLVYLVWRRKTRDINTPMLIATWILFALCTTHWALEFDNALHVLVLNPGQIHLADETHLLLGADILFSITDFFGNLVLTYRCWIAWGQAFWAGAIPLLIALASISCAMSGLGMLATTAPTAAIAPVTIARFGVASFSMSLILNFILTSLIVGKLYSLSRFARQNRDVRSQSTNTHGHSSHMIRSDGTGGTGKTQRQVRAAMAVIVESGMLFLVAQFIFVVLYALGHPAQGIIVPITLQIYGIAPMLIIVRVGMGLTSDSSTTAVATGTTASLHFAALASQQNHTKSAASEMELSPIDGADSTKGDIV